MTNEKTTKVDEKEVKTTTAIQETEKPVEKKVTKEDIKDLIGSVGETVETKNTKTAKAVKETLKEKNVNKEVFTGDINLKLMMLDLGYPEKQWKSQKSRLVKSALGKEGSDTFTVSIKDAKAMLDKLALGKSKYRAQALELSKVIETRKDLMQEYIAEVNEKLKPLGKKQLLEIVEEIKLYIEDKQDKVSKEIMSMLNEYGL